MTRHIRVLITKLRIARRRGDVAGVVLLEARLRAALAA
jgi:hypothetical protein